MKKWFFVSMTLLMFCLPAYGQEVYRWVDEKGTVHFSDDLTLVPERYREQVEKKRLPKESGSSPVTPSRERGSKAEPPSPPAKRDLYGRGEAWWRAKAKEWNDKLEEAQKKYDAASQALKEKERQLEDSKFKPHNQRKNLEKEVKELEERAKEREKELEEVKNMVEKVLPRQAEEDKADLSWLKPKEQGGPIAPPAGPGAPPGGPVAPPGGPATPPAGPGAPSGGPGEPAKP